MRESESKGVQKVQWLTLAKNWRKVSWVRELAEKGALAVFGYSILSLSYYSLFLLQYHLRAPVIGQVVYKRTHKKESLCSKEFTI